VVRTAGELIHVIALAASGVVPDDDMANHRGAMMSAHSDLRAAVATFQLIDRDVGFTLDEMMEHFKQAWEAAVEVTAAERARAVEPLTRAQITRNNWMLRVTDRLHGGDGDLVRLLAAEGIDGQPAP
jgi:hypothetical protein